MPICEATPATASSRSPERISGSRPSFANSRRASGAPGRSLSSKTKTAIGPPFFLRTEIEAPPGASTSSSLAQPRPSQPVDRIPRSRFQPETGKFLDAVQCRAGKASSGIGLGDRRARQDAGKTGPCSAAIAMAAGSIRSALRSDSLPSVSVPVLSKTTLSASARRSSALPSLTMMPRSNSRRAATTWTIGTASPSAQGQVMIRTEIAMVIDRCQSPEAAASRGRTASASGARRANRAPPRGRRAGR